MSVASALAEVPGRVESMFLNTDSALNDAGIYAVNLYALGVPHTVIVDDFLPVTNRYGSYDTHFGNVSKDGAMWIHILEKAFAKFHGNYMHIVGGFASNSSVTVQGGPNKEIKHTTNTKEMNSLWK